MLWLCLASRQKVIARAPVGRDTGGQTERQIDGGGGREGGVLSINPTIIFRKRYGCVWFPTKNLLHANVHQWAETPVGRKRERKKLEAGGGERRFID